MPTVIQVENLSKQYRLGIVGANSIKDDFSRYWARIRGKEDPTLKIGATNSLTSDKPVRGSVKLHSDYVWALKDINFNVQQGDVLGIIGKNGAGKSTLLKILSKVTAPTTGNVKVKGSIASLLEVGTGFHAELSGRENIFLNGAILGMTKAEIRSKFDEIVDFSGVENYIDTPVKRYSSGMYVRLAFAVAAHLDPEILIVDEVLAVGDAEFQKKALGKMQNISSSQGRTVLFVSHNMGAINQLCKTAIILKNGELFLQGSSANVISKYLQSNFQGSSFYHSSNTSEKKICFKSITPSDKEGILKEDFFHDEDIYFTFEFYYNIEKNSHDYSLFFMVLDENKNRIFASESGILREDKILLRIEKNFLTRGQYSIHCFIHKPQTEQTDAVTDACNFSVIDNGSPFNIHSNYDYGKVFGRCEWQPFNNTN